MGQIVGKSFAKKKEKLTFFHVTEMKPVAIVFEKKIDNIKEVNQNYVKT